MGRPVIEASYRILVVDDDPQTAVLVKSWYRGKPFEILTAGDGEEGLKRAAAERPDLLLLDVTMPRMDGLEVARRLKSNPATRTIPVLLLTARRETTDKVEGFRAGADDYVVKPFAFEEVDARIRAMLRRRELVATLESTVEELQVSNRQLEGLLVIDEKTGLFNYREFERKLREEWLRALRYETPLSVIMLDLDRFKAINDTRGHPAGDRVLREFAMLVAGGARGTDVAARFGGEEFAVILPHTGGPLAARVAERIRAAVNDFVFLEPDDRLRVTVSAGIATWPSFPSIDSAEALVAAADRALLKAKVLGRNRVVVDEGS
ncbi:MAG TPA: diguanylate cyclase [Candidatus Polarisedimenticolaceae bacterium]